MKFSDAADPRSGQPMVPSQRRHFCLRCHDDHRRRMTATERAVQPADQVPMILVEEAGQVAVFECVNGHRVEIRLDEVSPRQALI